MVYDQKAKGGGNDKNVDTVVVAVPCDLRLGGPNPQTLTNRPFQQKKRIQTYEVHRWL